MKCRSCKESYAPIGKRTCKSCSRPRTRKEYLRDRYRENVAAGRCTTCCKNPVQVGRKKCEECLSYLRTGGPSERKSPETPSLNSLKGYVPIDEWLETPRAQLLRVLRRFDWIEFDDIKTALGVHGGRSVYEKHYQMLRRLVKRGLAQSRETVTWLGARTTEYRLAPGVSVAPPQDLTVCSDEEAA